MQSVTINTRKYKSRHDLEHFLKEKHLGKGDKVEIIASDIDPFSFLAVVLLTLFAVCFVLTASREKNYADHILDNLFENEDIDVLEKKIEKEFGVDILVTKDAAIDTEEKEFWNSLGSQSFQKAYSENEPDYKDVKVLEPNPKYGK